MCTAAAAAYRVLLLATMHDVPGDGPSRAAIAMAWARAPELPTCGGWPPGHVLLAGLFQMLLPGPASTRLLNVVLGTLSVPLLYAAVARTWDRGVALLAAAMLAVLPLHAELAATSLTEATFTCALLLAWWLLVRAAQADAPGARGARVPALLAAGLALSLAQMLRYEGWAFAPVVVVWWLWCTRSARHAALLAALVLWFPIAWTAGNARCGDAFLGFHAALGELAVPTDGDPIAKVTFAARVVRGELGVLATLAVLAGAAWEIVLLRRGRSSRERVLAIAFTGTAWAVLGAAVAARGASVWTRYFVPALVLALPFAAASLQLARGDGRLRRRAVTLVAGVLLLALVVPDLAGRRSRHWLRAEPPRAAAGVAAWLAADPARMRMPILATPAGWELTYLPLLAPDAYWRFRTCSPWSADQDVVRWIDALRGAGPFLVITRDGDEAELARLERAAGRPLAVGAPVLSADGVRAYVVQLPAAAS
ncbi:glycosyltransferase family 39 protein [Candidatus Binatia bacterium]|nr:glycosyltransferase family 39 protein [Candidatus Binatia bacterium]